MGAKLVVEPSKSVVKSHYDKKHYPKINRDTASDVNLSFWSTNIIQHVIATSKTMRMRR